LVCYVRHMDEHHGELPPYLPSEETGGHVPADEPDYWHTDKLSLISIDDSQPIDKILIEKYELSSIEVEFLSRLQVSRFLSDGNTRENFPLTSEELVKTIELLKKLDFSEKELGMVLAGKTSLHQAVALHGLQTFEQRLEQNMMEEDFSKNSERRWDIASGDYGFNGFATRIVYDGEDDLVWEAVRAVPENMRVEDLLGEELTLADIIQQSLSERNGSEDPVMVLDVGGLAGLSWHRLANRFKVEVEAGKLAFVVTSLSADFDNAMSLVKPMQFNAAQKDKDERYDRSANSRNMSTTEYDFIMKTRDLVHHIKADVPALLAEKIKVGGVDYPLSGNVSLANDNSAVALHSLIPSRHLPMISSLLNGKGIYKTNIRSTFYAPKQDHFRSRDAELYRSFQILTNRCGMEQVLRAEEGSTEILEGRNLNQMFFREQGGPKIRAFLLPEQISSAKLSIESTNKEKTNTDLTIL